MDKALKIGGIRFDGIHSIYDMAADAQVKFYQLAIIRVKVGFNG